VAVARARGDALRAEYSATGHLATLISTLTNKVPWSRRYCSTISSARPRSKHRL
jgi:hypothetical protein